MVFSREHKHRVLPEKLWTILHDGKGLAGHAFNLLLVIVIIGSLALLPLEFIPQLQEFHATHVIMEQCWRGDRRHDVQPQAPLAPASPAA